MSKEITLIMLIIILSSTIFGLLWALLKSLNIIRRISARLEGIDDLLLTNYLINEREKDDGTTDSP
jgi:hypothetical protein